MKIPEQTYRLVDSIEYLNCNSCAWNRVLYISDLEYGGKGADEPLTVHGGDLQVVEVVRLQVGHHLGVDGVLHGHVRGQLAVAEDENLTEREKRAE